MTDKVYNVLFLCTGNSARSILAEVLLNRFGQGKFRAFSAGSHPTGAVHPMALELLRKSGLPTEGLRSKSWDDFATAPPFDFVFTVCDRAAAELCPVWAGHPMTAHWGVEDPAAAVGTEEQKRQAFRTAYCTLEARIRLFVSLPIAKLDAMRLRDRLTEIGTVRSN
jgi:arsenate reductase (thioredoxin)